MNRWRGGGWGVVPALAALAVAMGARSVLAADGRCAALSVQADERVRMLWPELADGAREALEARDDVDPCARVALSRAGTAIRLEVALPDGRLASRVVSGPEDVVPTLEALLLIPRAAAPEATEASGEPPQEPPAPPVLPSPAPAPVVARDAPPQAKSEPRRFPGFEISLATGARVGDGETVLGFGALSLVDVSAWLVGFGGEIDRYQAGAATTPGMALELAALGGRRMSFGGASLDFLGGLGVALHGGSQASTVTTMGTTMAAPVSTSTQSLASGAVPRVRLAAHMNFGARSAFRTFVGIEGDVGPTDASEAELPLAPGNPSRLPIWTLGLALGGTVGTP
jgi:hypothetical protein